MKRMLRNLFSKLVGPVSENPSLFSTKEVPSTEELLKQIRNFVDIFQSMIYQASKEEEEEILEQFNKAVQEVPPQLTVLLWFSLMGIWYHEQSTRFMKAIVLKLLLALTGKYALALEVYEEPLSVLPTT